MEYKVEQTCKQMFQNKPGLSLKLKDQVGILGMERNSTVEGESWN